MLLLKHKSASLAVSLAFGATWVGEEPLTAPQLISAPSAAYEDAPLHLLGHHLPPAAVSRSLSYLQVQGDLGGLICSNDLFFLTIPGRETVQQHFPVKHCAQMS